MSYPFWESDEFAKWRSLAGGGFGWFFFFGFFLFFFFLEFVAYEFEDGDFGSVADAVACGDDAGVASGAVGELRRDFAEEFFGDAGSHDVSSSDAARGKRIALAEGDHFFGDGTRCFRARQRGGDAAVLKKIGDQVAQGRAAMPRIAAKLGARFQVSHKLMFSVKSLADDPS